MRGYRYQPRYNQKREYDNLINELRIEKGLTLENLSVKIQVSRNYLWRISQGYEAPVKQNGVVKFWAAALCQHLDCDFSDLFPYDFCSPDNKMRILTYEQLEMLLMSDFSYSTAKTDSYEKKEVNFVINDVLATLTDRERKIVELKYGDEFNNVEISKITGISNTRVGQILARALRKLRQPSRSRKLKPFLNERR